MDPMKFSEMSYTRPDIDALLGQCKALAAKAAGAASGEELVNVYYEQSRAFADYSTAAQLASIHYTCDTRDAYWKAEQDFIDANSPAVSGQRPCGRADRSLWHHLRGRYEERRAGHG